MARPIEFFFDFSSPYGYIASHLIDDVAARHDREVEWKPFLLGAVFKIAGTKPLIEVPLKGDYSRKDFSRSARMYNIPFAMPAKFPIATVATARAFYWLAAQDAALARRFARAAYAAYFVQGRDVGDVELVLALGENLGVGRDNLATGLQEPTVKEKLKTVTDEAINERGVFGSPFIFVDGEGFWGSDRLPMIERWIETGGW